MTTPENQTERSPVRWPGRAPPLVVSVLLCAFLAGAFARLNALHVFNPDSADYVLQASGLARGRGYVHVEHPDAPPQTVRPPGLSLLLAPSQWLFPYDAVAAKVVVALSAGIAILLLYFLARGPRTPAAGPWPAVAVTALFATSPWTLLFGSEVLSEVPYVALTLALLWMLDSEQDDQRRWRLVAGTLLLGFLPLLRSVGLALVLAVGLWAVFARRWKWLLPVAAGLAAQAGWSLASATAGHSSYAARLAAELKTRGPLGLLVRTFQGGLFYFESLLSGVLPGSTGGYPVYWRVMVDGTTGSPVPPALLAVAAVALVVVGGLGLARRDTPAGTIGLIYVLLYFALVAAWPFRQDRFVWPLVPVLLAGVPRALQRLCERYGWSARTCRRMGIPAGLALLLIVGWQSSIDYRMIRANVDRLTARDDFYADQFPPFYYCDWPTAGRWIRENTPPDARVLARHASLACTSRRGQRLVRFETTPPEQLHAVVADFHATLLVVPGRRFPHLFPWHLLEQDPVYRFDVVYEAGDVAVLAVRPNRQGTVRHLEAPAEDDLTLALRATRRHPARIDLWKSLARALAARDRHAKVVANLQNLVERGVRDPGVFLLLGRALRELGRRDEALAAFRQGELVADLGPGTRRSLLQEIERVQQELEAGTATDDAPDAKLRLAYARWYAQRFDFRNAWDELQQCDLDDGEVRLLRGRVADRLGRPEEALAEYAAAEELGSDRAATARRFLQASRKLEAAAAADATAEVGRECLELAKHWIESNVPGRALDLLEHPPCAPGKSDADRPLELARLRAFYAQWDAAAQALDAAAAAGAAEDVLERERRVLEEARQRAKF